MGQVVEDGQKQSGLHILLPTFSTNTLHFTTHMQPHTTATHPPFPSLPPHTPPPGTPLHAYHAVFSPVASREAVPCCCHLATGLLTVNYFPAPAFRIRQPLLLNICLHSFLLRTLTACTLYTCGWNTNTHCSTTCVTYPYMQVCCLDHLHLSC